MKRIRKPNTKYRDFYQFLINQQNINHSNLEIQEYDEEEATVMAMFMQKYINKPEHPKITGVCNTQTYNLRKGILKYKDKGRNAVNKELTQLHNRKVFKPIHQSELTESEKKKAMNSLIFLTEKRDGTIKARACANGSTQRNYIKKDEATSPTVTTEALITTAVIDAKQGRDVVTLDIPNAFVQTPIPESEEKVIMRMTGLLVDHLVNLFPTEYKKYITIQNQTKILYVEMKKALYGMMLSSLLFYKHFRKHRI